MMRPFTLLCFIGFAVAGAWLYQVKHAVATKDREILDIRRQTETARARIDVLRAEWALLNEPERLRQTATRALTLEPMQPQHFVRPTDLERRLPTAVAFAGPPNIFAAPVMVAAAAPVTGAEAPAPQALAAAVAAQRAEQAARPAPRPAPPPRPLARTAEPPPIVPVSSPPPRPVRPAPPETAIASALGGASTGRPMLAPPVPIAPAAAATLSGR